MAPIVDDDDDEGVAPDAGAEPGTEAKPEGAAGAAPDLMKDVFGDDDDSDDDDAPAAKKKAKAPKAEVDSDADDESEDEISVGRRSRKSKKAPSKRASRRSEKGGKSKDVSAKEKERWDKLQGGKDADSGDEDDTEPARTAEDDAFIDDADVAPEDRYGDDDDERSPVASEAEEEDDDSSRSSSARRAPGRGRARQSEQALTSEALNFLARMEVAAEQDRESVLEKKPAVHKLRMLKEMTEKLKEVDLHEAFLRHGLLKVLASWLSLLPDHNLPNTTVRTAVIDAVRLLPVETDLTDRKEELKRSGLGGSSCSSPRSRRRPPRTERSARTSWRSGAARCTSSRRSTESAPGGGGGRPGRPPAEEEQKAKPPNAGAATGGPRRGQNRRRRAQVRGEGVPLPRRRPEPEAMDYKVRPKLKIDPSEIKARTQNADQHKIRKLLGKSAKARGVKDGKAYLPSIEGRGMVTYH